MDDVDRLKQAYIFVLGTLDELRSMGLVQSTDNAYELTEAGRREFEKVRELKFSESELHSATTVFAQWKADEAELEPLRQQLAAADRLAEAWRQKAIASREEAGRIRRTIKDPTDAEERAYVRAEVWENCADELCDALAAYREKRTC